MSLQIRKATTADAAAACNALRHSITLLCVDDHNGDKAEIESWLENKTPENMRAWIAAPGTTILVACQDHEIVGVGGVTHLGHITLNYVAPEKRFCGISKSMLSALEAEARTCGAVKITLESTKTAQAFYRAAGYSNTDPSADAKPQCRCIPMSKPS